LTPTAAYIFAPPVKLVASEGIKLSRDNTWPLKINLYFSPCKEAIFFKSSMKEFENFVLRVTKSPLAQFRGLFCLSLYEKKLHLKPTFISATTPPVSVTIHRCSQPNFVTQKQKQS